MLEIVDDRVPMSSLRSARSKVKTAKKRLIAARVALARAHNAKSKPRVAKAKLRVAHCRQQLSERRKDSSVLRQRRSEIQGGKRGWSVQVRATGACAVCGDDGMRTKLNKKTGKMVTRCVLNAHHLLPRERYPQFATVLINGICLCPGCHKYGERSFHRNPIWSTLWLRKHRPDQFLWCKAQLGKI